MWKAILAWMLVDEIRDTLRAIRSNRRYFVRNYLGARQSVRRAARFARVTIGLIVLAMLVGATSLLIMAIDGLNDNEVVQAVQEPVAVTQTVPTTQAAPLLPPIVNINTNGGGGQLDPQTLELLRAVCGCDNCFRNGR